MPLSYLVYGSFTFLAIALVIYLINSRRKK